MGKVLIPRNIENNEQILYSLKKEIEIYKGKHLPQIPITNILIGQKFNLNEIKSVNQTQIMPTNEKL